jgi:hypothetical protein
MGGEDMAQKLNSIGWLTLALALVVALGVGTAQAQPAISCNNAALTPDTAAITTFDFNGGATLNAFIPTGASVPGNVNNGRGVLVVGNKVYYSDLGGNGFGPTDFIRVAPFNGGAGGADIALLPNPRPADGVQDISIFKGQLYVLAGYPNDAPEVFVLNATTGAVISGPIAIAAPAATDSDGFTVLASGNFFMNSGDGDCNYNQYNPLTGALIPGTTIVVPGASFCTGVETDGVSLFFETDLNSFTQTDLAGNLIRRQDVAADQCEDIALASIACDAGVTISGSMEGNLPIRSGDTLRAGFDFTVPGDHPADTVTFSNINVSLNVQCPDKTTVTLNIPMPNQTFTDPAHDGGDWFPSNNQNSPLVYQGSITVPSICGGATGHAPKGATFTANLIASTTSSVNVRFHYSDGTSGSWSGTQGFCH